MTITQSPEFLVTSCPTHGVKVAPDAKSALFYQECAHECEQASLFSSDHDAEHARVGDDCWVCCNAMFVAGGIVPA